MKPEALLKAYLWVPGVCWRCETPDFVTQAEGTPADLETCAVCLLRLDQIRSARAQWRFRGGRRPTLGEITEQWPQPARDPVNEARLREWIRLILQPLDPAQYGEAYAIHGEYTGPLQPQTAAVRPAPPSGRTAAPGPAHQAPPARRWVGPTSARDQRQGRLWTTAS